MAEILIGNIKGPQGIQGEKGETGPGFKVLDYYTTVDELFAAITNPSVGDAYGVGSEHPYDIYIFSQSRGWVNNGALQGAKGEAGTDGKDGVDGIDGTNATITDVTATVDEGTGTPTVTVTMGGTESERSFAFAFSGLKGEQGPQGEKGETGADGIDGTVIDINEQTPTYTEATTLATLTSGEKISSAFSKIKKAITDFITHLADTTKHITSSERTTWNAKAPTSHASTATTYGVGTASTYGHLKITDSKTSTATDTAASAKALSEVYNAAKGSGWTFLKTQSLSHDAISWQRLTTTKVFEVSTISGVDWNAYDEYKVVLGGTFTFPATKYYRRITINLNGLVLVSGSNINSYSSSKATSFTFDNVETILKNTNFCHFADSATAPVNYYQLSAFGYNNLEGGFGGGVLLTNNETSQGTLKLRITTMAGDVDDSLYGTFNGTISIYGKGARA